VIAEQRPFHTFSALSECLSKIPRGANQLQLYQSYLENRSILDRVLDDCRQRSRQIQSELEKMQSADGGKVTAAGLNAECKLHPYQRVGLQWLVMMSRLGLDAILADEMGLGECWFGACLSTRCKD
jgi:SNF2 family DNA or RNA helicase